MPKPFKPVVLTANDLVEGDSVFLGAEGWVRDVAEATAEVGRNVVAGPSDRGQSPVGRPRAGFSYDAVPGVVETLVDTYLALRETPRETFLQTYRRVGMEPFREALYAEAH